MKLHTKSASPVAEEICRRNAEHARRLGFPRLGRAGAPRLAIVGGGPSIYDRVDELRAFDGDIWAINGAFHWLKERGLDPWFFSVDPTALIVPFTQGAERAILSIDCDPAVFDALSGAHVEAVDLTDMAHGPTTSTCAPAIALQRGYKELHFFGCEGSFGRTTHAYGDFNLENLLRVSCDGETFLTTHDMMVQVEYLGEIIREAYVTCKDKSGGLLAAYIRKPDIDVLAAKPAFHAAVMRKIEAAHDMGVEELMSREYRKLSA